MKNTEYVPPEPPAVNNINENIDARAEQNQKVAQVHDKVHVVRLPVTLIAVFSRFQAAQTQFQMHRFHSIEITEARKLQSKNATTTRTSSKLDRYY